MKRYVMLFAFTSFAIISVVVWGAFSRNSVVQVSVVKVNPLTVENSVTCSGRVERISTHTVYSPAAAIVSRVYVRLGDKVSAGQPLIEIQLSSVNAGTANLEESYQSMLSQYGRQSQNAVTVQTITAPCAGEVTALPVADKGYIELGSQVAIISDSSGRLQVRLSVNESQISDIKIGKKAVITGVGFKNTAYSGIVKSISSDAKQVTSTTGQETVVEVIVSVDKTGGDIKPGYTAKAKIITSENPDVLVVPYETVRADKYGSEYVFKLNGKKAVKAQIVTNREFDSGFEITSGLSEKDEIIANPDLVSNGTYVIPMKKGALSSGD